MARPERCKSGARVAHTRSLLELERQLVRVGPWQVEQEIEQEIDWKIEVALAGRAGGEESAVAGEPSQ